MSKRKDRRLARRKDGKQILANRPSRNPKPQAPAFPDILIDGVSLSPKLLEFLSDIQNDFPFLCELTDALFAAGRIIDQEPERVPELEGCAELLQYLATELYVVWRAANE